MKQVETITDYLKRRLREAGAAQFEQIAQEAGVTCSFIRKFVYGSRENPRVQTIQPLVDYFAAVDRGVSATKPAAAPSTARAAASGSAGRPRAGGREQKARA